MGHWETIAFITSLRQTGIVAPMLIKGAMNGEAFLAYIEQCLAPTLKRGDIVVADNPFTRSRCRGGSPSDSCRSILPTLTPSNWPSIPQRLACARPPSAQSKDCTD